MGWLGLAIAALWPAVAALLVRRFPVQSPRILFLLNLIVPTGGWGLACFTGLDLPAALRWVAFGLGLSAFPVAAQAVTAALAASESSRIAARWSKREFVRYQASNTLLMTAPPGLVLALLGFALSDGRPLAGSVLDILVAAVVFLLLWKVMWMAVREMRVPGRLLPFPEGAWLTELQRLARKMGVSPVSVFIAHTRRGRIAGAYCLGRSRVGIADALLAALTMEEFKAVMAHEMAHLSQARSTIRYLALSTATVVCSGLVCEALGQRLPETVGDVFAISVVVFVSVACLRGLVRLKRRQEDEADEAAVVFVGAAALIGALAKATLLNGGTFDHSSNRYRSLDERIRRLAALGGCNSSEVDHAIAMARNEIEQVRPPGPIFAAAERSNREARPA
ncbi:MAG: M48 family metalloprotease [Fimbriimonadaceae bacterium]|nr:M48 family metalloprotease [Fimbriimonadaceae bacterium]